MMDRLSIAAKHLITDEHTVEVIEKAATKLTYASSGITVISGLTVNEWGVLGGLVLGVLTLGVKVYFEKQRLKILQERGEL